MGDRLITIDDLFSILPNRKDEKGKIKKYLIKGTKFCCAFLILRVIFVLPIFIFSNSNSSFLQIYTERYTYSSPSYDKIWNNFKGAFFNVFQNNSYLIKYMIISFVILSIILIIFLRSPMAVLISFVVVGVSPYVIKNIFLPLIAFIYIPLNFICLFIDNLIPSCIPTLLVWGGGGFLFGITKVLGNKNKKFEILFYGLLLGIFIVTKCKFPLEQAIKLSSVF